MEGLQWMEESCTTYDPGNLVIAVGGQYRVMEDVLHPL